MLLTVKERQKRLAYLGLYTGKIDGKDGKLTKEAYKKLQNKYFTRVSDKDGIYGKDTDILLRNAYVVELNTRNFDLPEFKCECGGKYCTGYPTTLSAQLLKNMQTLRKQYGSITITSGLRCKGFNSILTGSVPTSYHLKGKAVDFACQSSATLAGRRQIMKDWKKLASAGYTYCNENGSAPNMGTAIHVQVK